jgi:plastocyanin
MTSNNTVKSTINTWLVLLVGFLLGVMCLALIFLTYRVDLKRWVDEGDLRSRAKTQANQKALPMEPSVPPRANRTGASTFQPRLRKVLANENAPTPEEAAGPVITGQGGNSMPGQSTTVAGVVTASLASAFVESGITGKVTLKGTPPPEKPLPLDPICGQIHETILTTRFYQVAPDGGLADVFVYIKEGLNASEFGPSTEPVVLDQVGCVFFPYVLGLQTGQKLLVRNSDPILHNVHVTPSPKSGNKESNRAQLSRSKELEFVFENPDVFVRFSCDVHFWMFAYVGVVSHPFFAVTDADGNYRLPATLAAGRYTIEAYHRKAGRTSEVIDVGEREKRRIDFSLEAESVSGN